MREPVLEILDPGFGATIQDHGRAGWGRYGVPVSGAMDDHAASWANRLLHNPEGAPVVEFLLHGLRMRALAETWIAVTGADASSNIPSWSAVNLRAGDVVEFPRNRSGVWGYISVEGGLAAVEMLGSASTYQRAQLGTVLKAGDILHRRSGIHFEFPPQVSGRFASWEVRRNYDAPPRLRLWPGPQWSWFSEEDREVLFTEAWNISAQSDRVGYRLLGKSLQTKRELPASEAVLVGSIQVPQNGLPIALMRDCPTIGGYPKVALIEPLDMSWLAQCRPGQRVYFCPAHENRSEL